MGFQIGIDLLAKRIEPVPGGVGKRFRDPRRFADAPHVHLEGEVDIGAPAVPEIGAAER